MKTTSTQCDMCNEYAFFSYEWIPNAVVCNNCGTSLSDNIYNKEK